MSADPWSVAAAGEPHAVLVLLGDPRLPDPVKPAGASTAEDLDSVVRLRAALATLEGYRFDWLDDHEHALDALRGRSRDIVFNLCDTGHRNRRGRELHVPALLELLDVPYSGAAPACLACATTRRWSAPSPRGRRRGAPRGLPRAPRRLEPRGRRPALPRDREAQLRRRQRRHHRDAVVADPARGPRAHRWLRGQAPGSACSSRSS